MPGIAVGTAAVAVGSAAVAGSTAAVAGSIAVGESTVTGTESAGRCRSMQDSAVEDIIKLSCGNFRHYKWLLRYEILENK